ncbi:hypothetical protein SAMN02745975_00616 [Geosporobacter subterraneus DSM 17957]|uniref:Uncharacterized protein n=1 Tax=Geosporobacter subterraneus DSM 17957 TaxID=1121919 RepID=A0A1M6E1Y1_9FIRM|nr:hypothetical protein [Geosporobacter subterraneus]SHI79497.1 hypothetical protein SAMN02745975_00616 [Geosporobacter subterraneus DSM 17957]
MSIRPIDFQILVPKTQQTSQDYQHQQNKLRLEQQHLVQSSQKEASHHLNKVNAFSNKDESRIKDYREKNESNSNHSNGKGRRKKKDGADQEASVLPGIGGNIDIKI